MILPIGFTTHAQISSQQINNQYSFLEGTLKKALIDYDGTDFTIRNQEFTATGSADIQLESVNGNINLIAGNELRGRFQSDGGLRLFATNNSSFLIDVQNDGDLKFIGDGGLVAMNINDGNGRVGVGTESPSHLLDVDGMVRVRELQEIQGGTGRQVFVDDNGVLSIEFIPTLSQNNSTALQADLQEKEQQLQTLEARVTELETVIQQLVGQQKNNTSLPSYGSYLQQNEPNPHHGQTTIRYQLPDHSAHYQLQVTNANGQVVQVRELDQSGQVHLSGLTTGIYHYSLLKNGQPLESKTMVVQR